MLSGMAVNLVKASLRSERDPWLISTEIPEHLLKLSPKASNMAQWTKAIAAKLDEQKLRPGAIHIVGCEDWLPEVVF